jgi:hypothetical protein
MISNGCLAIVYFVEIILCVKMTSKANPPEIVRKSAEACAELIPSKSDARYQKQFSHFYKWKSENNVKYGRGKLFNSIHYYERVIIQIVQKPIF